MIYKAPKSVKNQGAYQTQCLPDSEMSLNCSSILNLNFKQFV